MYNYDRQTNKNTKNLTFWAPGARITPQQKIVEATLSNGTQS